jgi:PAS domain S-box-containing protein
MVRYLPSEKEKDSISNPSSAGLEGILEFGGQRAVLMDVATGFYEFKKILRADIGFFEKDFMTRSGHESAKSYLVEFQKAFGGKDPKTAFEEMLKQYAARGYGSFKLDRFDEKAMIAEVSSANTTEAWAFRANSDMQREPVCSYTAGILSGIAALVFSDQVEPGIDFVAVELECAAQGDEECEFVVGPLHELKKRVPSYSLARDSPSEHVLRLNEEILLRNLELQGLNLSLERGVRKRTEDLRRSEENYQRLVELSPDPIVLCTLEGAVNSINESGLKLLGFESIAEIGGLDLRKVISEGEDVWAKLIWQLEKEGAVHNLELDLVRKDGTAITAEASARFAELVTGKCVEAIIRDVTERKIIQAQMVEAKSETDFLNDLLSHDITNFTVSAMYFLETIRKSESLSDQDRKNLAIVLKDVQGAFELSTSVRDLSRAKSMSNEDLEVKELQQLIAEGIEEAKRLFSERSVVINFERSPEPRFIRGNPVISRLFTNVLTNAVKFDPSNEVVVDISIESEVQKGVAFWRVSVADRGKGIPDSEKDLIFDRFHRLDTSVPGTGLGLYVTRFIARSCGGRIWAEDRVPGDHTKGTKMNVLLQKATQREIAETSRTRKG